VEVLDELRAYDTQRGGWVEVDLTGELSLVALVNAIWCTRPLKLQFQANRRSHEAPAPGSSTKTQPRQMTLVGDGERE
jgi:hypothetical protein